MRHLIFLFLALIWVCVALEPDAPSNLRSRDLVQVEPDEALVDDEDQELFDDPEGEEVETYEVDEGERRLGGRGGRKNRHRHDSSSNNRRKRRKRNRSRSSSSERQRRRRRRRRNRTSSSERERRRRRRRNRPNRRRRGDRDRRDRRGGGRRIGDLCRASSQCPGNSRCSNSRCRRVGRTFLGDFGDRCDRDSDCRSGLDCERIDGVDRCWD